MFLKVKNLVKFFLLAIFVFGNLSLSVSGQEDLPNIQQPEDFRSLVQIILDIISLLIPILIGLTVAVFIWGLYRYIPSAASEEDKIQGKKFMIFGILGLFVMISVWAIVGVILGTFGIEFVLPQLKTSS